MKTDTGLAHDVFRGGRHPLDPFFKPRSVAVIGATETPGSVGRTVLANLVATSFGGVVHPVNPRRDTVLGLQAYPAVGDVPGPVDRVAMYVPPSVGITLLEAIKSKAPAAELFLNPGSESDALHDCLQPGHASHCATENSSRIALRGPRR